MTEPQEIEPRRRRTRQEVQRLVSEFGTSGLSRGEFCRIHAMTSSTLQRGLKRARAEPSEVQSDGKRVMRVKVIGGSGRADREPRGAMTVVLAKGGASSRAGTLTRGDYVVIDGGAIPTV